jgi:glutamate 5-kinase
MSYQRILIKIGTSTLTRGTNQLDLPKLIDIVRQVSVVQSRGVQMTLVSSGAVAAGRELLNYPIVAKHVPGKQLLSSIGQPRLMSIYSDLFKMYGHHVAQILLTRSDFVNRRSYLNARNTMECLLDQNVIPIINENDAIATDEIRLGDNDTMSAYVSGLIGADLLVLLTDQNGLFTDNPEKNADARLIDTVDTPDIHPFLWEAAGGSVSGLGTGGMHTKLRAADLARRMGTTTMIVNGAIEDIIIRIASGERFGTVFRPTNTVLESRKRYLLTGYNPGTSAITIDAGAEKAVHAGKSLLPAGIKSVSGEFDRGDTVKIVNEQEEEIILGMVNYSSEEIKKICGMKANQIESILGYCYTEEVVHRDNMIGSEII